MSKYICKICGKEFERKSNAVYCGGPHYRPCPVCGKPVEFKKPGDRVNCCSKECANKKKNQGRMRTLQERHIIKICEYCGEEFVTSGVIPSKERFCKRPHYTKCGYCGKSFLIKSMEYIPKACSKECSDKLKYQTLMNSMKEIYGVTHYTQVPEFKDKADATRIKHIEQQREHFRKTCLERYGVDHPMKVPEIHQRSVETNLERYGVENPSYNDDIKRKISEIAKSDEFQAKYRATSLAHYGVEYPAQSAEVQEQMQQTCIEKYGVPYSTQNTEIKKKLSDSLIRTHMLHPEIVAQQQAKAKQTILERYGVEHPCQLSQCRNATNTIISQQNTYIGDALTQLGVEVQYEKPLKSYSYDLFIPSLGVCVEVDPTYTHNSYGNHYGCVRDMYYHLNKTKVANEFGYRCIHVFDWDDKNKIINLLSPKNTINAIDCVVRKISSDVACSFEEKYHLQGTIDNQDICLGLYFNDELVQIVTFGKAKNDYDYELLKLCSINKYTIINGAEMLWEYFIDIYSPKSVVAYCDLAKFTGDTFVHLFKDQGVVLAPNKLWSKGMMMITDTTLKQQGFHQLFDIKHDDSATDEELMIQYGWLPIYDCGLAKYVWKAD